MSSDGSGCLLCISHQTLSEAVKDVKGPFGIKGSIIQRFWLSMNNPLMPIWADLIF